MAYQSLQSASGGVWELAEQQHGVVTRTQLLELGLHPQAIKHRLAKGRLHPIRRGVYAVGRPRLSRYGRWMAAVLSCGPRAVLSHASAAALWEIGAEPSERIEVSVPGRVARCQSGIVVHRRQAHVLADSTRCHGIPVTTPVCTLIDIATRLGSGQLEAAINQADKRSLTDPEALRRAADAFAGRPGVRALRRTLDRRTFALTESELERRFLPIIRSAGLPLPQTRRRVRGFRVDFYWPELGLVVETDGLRYHRTPAAQARDRVRDQAHIVAGLVPLRFTHSQIRFKPRYVRTVLAAVANRLNGRD